ncbi:hypothetical protein PPYR_10470 [Photinus pyralis]|uniref:Uncharacterized protein n=1 Tax=Photinus pyralis TaxID=7054 RepID=A0A5N4AGJ6_PHOPY|nr:uncharacterized protein LOC116173474 [Photinus pyralis]KAB0796409.1 hypothetical protein PPYR_10470 [Photinus pyralis]
MLALLVSICTILFATAHADHPLGQRDAELGPFEKAVVETLLECANTAGLNISAIIDSNEVTDNGTIDLSNLTATGSTNARGISPRDGSEEPVKFDITEVIRILTQELPLGIVSSTLKGVLNLLKSLLVIPEVIICLVAKLPFVCAVLSRLTFLPIVGPTFGKMCPPKRGL